jgi:tetratricopeptide (TPR) repeat protein
MKIRPLLAIGIVVLALAHGGQARADRKTDAQAKSFYDEGTKYYSLGDFPKAIERYKKAFELKPDAVFLYNIAQAYRLSNDFTQALFFYKSFLRNLPNAPNREEVENRIKEMDEAQAKQKATANAPPIGPVAPGGSIPDDSGANTDLGTTEPGDGSSTGVPDPADVGAASDAGQQHDTPTGTGPVDSGGGKKPIYKKWWFWAGVGAVAVGTVAIIAVSSGGGGGAPGGDFGAVDVF